MSVQQQEESPLPLETESASSNLTALEELKKPPSRPSLRHNETLPIIRAFRGNFQALGSVAAFLDNPGLLFYLCKDVSGEMVFRLMCIRKFNYKVDADNKLVERKIFKDEEKEDAVINLIQSGNARDLKILFKGKLLDMDAMYMDQSLLRYGIESNQTEVTKTLIEYGAKIDHPTIDILELAFKRNVPEIILLLLKNETVLNGIPIGYVFTDNHTVLTKAVEIGDINLVKRLLKSGGHFEINSGEIFNPLYLAIYYNDIAMIELLLDNGARTDIKPTEKKEYPLDFFIECWRCITDDSRARNPRNFNNAIHILTLLQKHGVDLREVNTDKIEFLFKEREYCLVGALIQWGVNEQITMEQLCEKLPSIMKEAEKNNDWNAICFWTNTLAEKLEQYFHATKAELASRFAEDSTQIQGVDGLPGQTLEQCHAWRALLYSARAMPAICQSAKEHKSWGQVQFFIDNLNQAAQKYFELSQVPVLDEVKVVRRRTSSDLTDSESLSSLTAGDSKRDTDSSDSNPIQTKEESETNSGAKNSSEVLKNLRLLHINNTASGSSQQSSSSSYSTSSSTDSFAVK